ncbi:MAG: ferritin-like domain-containing protein [Chloroflexi bacterium]|nr:ferritin-like domain-containing protein [Chloroflexota bacterium]MDA8187674.1 DUF892 family protein [Dehalococcoidales bacterium]
MTIQKAEELFLYTLSHLHNSENHLLRTVQEMSKAAHDKDIKEALELRVYLSKQAISNIEECFRLLGKQPMKVSSRFQDVWMEDFLKELNEIQAPALKALYTIHKVRQIQEMHIAEYAALENMAQLMGNFPVATLLERNLEDKVAFVEQTDEIIREIGRTLIVGKMKKAA